MIRELQDKMIELGTQDLMVAGSDEVTAKATAERDVKRAADLFRRALIATGIEVTYRREMGAAMLPDAEPGDAGLDAMRAANPGVYIQPTGDGGFKADSPFLKFPVTPPRPVHAASELLEHATKLKEADRDSRPVPPEDDAPECMAMPDVPDRQELEDRLRTIADIIDGQPPFGTELANFQRRLRMVLNGGR